MGRVWHANENTQKLKIIALLSVEQRKLLLQGKELIKYKRFDYRGVYEDTQTENILMQCPRDLRPINTNLVKSYGKPVKKVTTQVKVETKVIKNTNPNFTAAKLTAPITNILNTRPKYRALNPLKNAAALPL